MRPLITLFCLLPLWLSAQAPPALYKNEIGIDPLIAITHSPGLGLVWKYVVGKVETTDWQKRTALRLAGAYYQDKIDTDSLLFLSGDSIREYFTSNTKKHSGLVFAGIERQLTQGRLRFFYGVELGYRYSIYTADHEDRITSLSTGNIISSALSNSEVRTFGGRFGGLGGAEFFLGPHWSLGVELNLNMGLDLSRSRIQRNGVWGPSYENTVGTVDTRLAPLLYVSWHFGEVDVLE